VCADRDWQAPDPAAARRAGYSAKDAARYGSHLLKLPDVQDAVATAFEERKNKVKIEAEFVLRELIAVVSVDLADAFDTEGNLKPIRDMPLDVRKALASVQTETHREVEHEHRDLVDEEPTARNVTVRTNRVKLCDRLRALELLGRHLGMFHHKVEVAATSNIAERLRAARKVVDPGAAQPVHGKQGQGIEG
jgi:phage terminase small subunit